MQERESYNDFILSGNVFFCYKIGIYNIPDPYLAKCLGKGSGK